jgi:uncharacterized Zn finger protein (UPF0148 family)
MNCQNCGGYIKRRDTYCPHCGEKLTSSAYKSHNKKNNFKHDESFNRKNSDYNPRYKKKNREYKPLQNRFKRGEYQDQEDDYYNQYIEEQFIDERQAYERPKKKKHRGYDLSEYYPDEDEKSGMGMLPIILILLIALLVGFIIGIMIFSTSSLPSIG